MLSINEIFRPQMMKGFRLSNLMEFTLIFAIGIIYYFAITKFSPISSQSQMLFSGVVVLTALAKVFFFFTESKSELLQSIRVDLKYHKFLELMSINMLQVSMSFAVDFFLLFKIDSNSFSSLEISSSNFENFFNFIFYSVLNFSFFGFGDITPLSISAKFLTMLEVLLAFMSVIYILSDFSTLKDSIKGKK